MRSCCLDTPLLLKCADILSNRRNHRETRCARQPASMPSCGRMQTKPDMPVPSSHLSVLQSLSWYRRIQQISISESCATLLPCFVCVVWLDASSRPMQLSYLVACLCILAASSDLVISVSPFSNLVARNHECTINTRILFAACLASSINHRWRRRNGQMCTWQRMSLMGKR